jgi:hypothetical protein
MFARLMRELPELLFEIIDFPLASTLYKRFRDGIRNPAHHLHSRINPSTSLCARIPVTLEVVIVP